MKKSIFKFLPLAFLAVTFTSCEEDGDGTGGTGDNEQKIAGWIIDTEAIASSVYNAIDQLKRDSTLKNLDTISFQGAMASLNGNVYTIDYGTGVVDNAGITRKGAITVTENGDYFTQGGLLSLAFNSFSVDDKTVAGSIAVSNLGNDTLSMVISNLVYDNLLTYNADKKVKWISGFTTTKDATDDVFNLSGDATGMENGTNNQIAIDFTSPMNFDRTCQYTVTEGILGLTFTGDSLTSFDEGSVDFISSDGCNNQLILNVTSAGGASVTLPRTFNGF